MFKNVLFLILLLLANPSLWSTSPTVLWSFDLKAPSFGNACSADLDDDGILEIVFSTYTNDGYIYVLNSEDGSVLWKYNTNGCNDAAPLIIDVDRDGQLDIILRTSCSNMMYCFNGRDGTIKWQLNAIGSDSPPSAADADKDGQLEIYDGDFYGNLSCFLAGSGALKWVVKVDSGSSIQTSPVIHDLDGDGLLDCVVATWTFDKSKPNKIAAYNLLNGTEKWSCYEPNEVMYHGPTIWDIDSDNIPEVVIGSYDGVLYCLNGIDGTLKWSFNFPDLAYIGAPTTMGDINGDGKLEIVFISGAKIGVLDNQGKLIWSYNMQTGITAFRGVVLSDVNNDGLPDVILGNYGGSILALNGIDGNLIFEYSIAQIYGKQLIIDHGPLVADFNQDGLTDIFVVGGLTYYPQVENNYGRAYMITTNSASSGKDWLMFRANEERNAVLPINTTSVRDNYETKCKLFYSSFNDIDNTFKLYFAKELLSTVDISIVDILGNIIIQTNSSYTTAKANQISVNVSGLANGLYYILVKNESNISFNKILKY